MTVRQQAMASESRAATDDDIRAVAGPQDPADQITRATHLFDPGAILAGAYEQLKAKALARAQEET